MLHFMIIFSVLTYKPLGIWIVTILRGEQLSEANANVNVCIANCMLQFAVSYCLNTKRILD